MSSWILPHIVVTRETDAIDDQTAINWCNAVQRQVTNHFRAAYGTNASILFLPEGTEIPTGQHVWRCHLMKTSDVPGAGGYHDDQTGAPILKVFVDDLIQYGMEPSVAFSHEVLEAIADPLCGRSFQVGDTEFWAFEVCDSCEADQFAYPITLRTTGATVMVSDFVTEPWFTGDPGPYDYMGHIDQAFQLLEGGYIGAWTPQKGWYQLTTDDKAPQSHRIPARAIKYPVEGAE